MVQSRGAHDKMKVCLNRQGRTGFCSLAFAGALLPILFNCRCLADELPADGRWQGKIYPQTANMASSPSLTGKMIVKDSGGSGGSFGKGDLRNALQDVHFWNDRIGWTCGFGGVFSTLDGGLTWARVKPRGGWYQIEMSGEKEIWVMEGQHPGGPGKAQLYHSTDAGKTWTERAAGKISGYRDLYCRGNERWVMCATYGAWQSLDGGLEWKMNPVSSLLQPSKISIPADVAGVKGQPFIYILGMDKDKRKIVRSEDGGRNWKILRLPEKAEANGSHADRLFFVSTWEGWIGGSKGDLWHTTDAGETWKEIKLPTDQAVNAILFDQCGRGEIGLRNNEIDRPRDAMLATVNGGGEWRLALSGYKQVNAFFSRGSCKWWAVGDAPGRVYNDLVIICEP